MPKNRYVVVHSSSSYVVEANDHDDAIKEFVKQRLQTQTYNYNGKISATLSGNVVVHELDDGTEYKVEGKIDVSVTKAAKAAPVVDEMHVEDPEPRRVVKVRTT